MSAGSQAVAQGCEGVGGGAEPPADKYWREGGPGRQEASCLCLILEVLESARSLPTFTLNSSTELRAHPARTCWKNQAGPRSTGRRV